MAIFDELKSIAKTLREADKIEQYQQILDIQNRLLEMQKRIMKLEEENKELKKKIGIKENLKYDDKNNVYWMEDKNKEQSGPYCPRCWDAETKLIHLEPKKIPNLWFCPQCKNYFGSGKNRPQYPSAGGRSIFNEYI